MKKFAVISALCASAASIAMAEDQALVFPEGSFEEFSETSQNARVAFPIGPFIDEALEKKISEGASTRNVWKTPKTTTAKLATDLRTQLETAGYDVLFECQTRECGGFDFRFALDVVDEPAMHVDLGDFRYLTVRQGEGQDEKLVGLLISRSPERGFVQITSVAKETEVEPTVTVSTKLGDVNPEIKELTLSESLLKNGSAVLEGLRFGQGESGLDESSAEALDGLAKFLNENPAKTVVLVGHTDASGSLDRNVFLSKKRAASVAQRLIQTYGVKPNQLTSEGVGYLSPRASNATEEGRDLNRRVEVVLTSIE